MSDCTFSNGIDLAVPTIEGITDAVEAIKRSHQAGKWIMIAPDGRLWENADPMILFAALACEMQGSATLWRALKEIR